MPSNTGTLSVIVFSKDRPLQLHAYLESFFKFEEFGRANISVLYKESPGVSYNQLKKEFPGVAWIQETDFFQDSFRLINEAGEFIMFGVDDVVFKRKMNIAGALQIMESNPELFGFSLRLGANITPVPRDMIDRASYLEWNWANTNCNHWNYPWELIATIYRKSDVIDVITKLDFRELKNPNYFEGRVAENKYAIVPRQKMGCFKQSSCVVITINRVQDDFLNGFDNTLETDIQTLYNLYASGERLDISFIEKKNNSDVHVGAEYFLLKGRKQPLRLKLKFKFQAAVTKIKKMYHLLKK